MFGAIIAITIVFASLASLVWRPAGDPVSPKSLIEAGAAIAERGG